MADQITTAFKRQFSDHFRDVAQQKQSKLRSLVEVEPISGDQAYVDYVGKGAEPPPQVSLIQATPLNELAHYRRLILATSYPEAIPLSKQALSRLIADPTYKYAEALNATFNRLIDKKLLLAAIGDASAVSTDALTVTATPLPATQKYTESGTVGMTAEKIITALEAFHSADVDDSAQKNLALAPRAVSDLLLDPDLTIADMMALEQVRQGKISQVFGFTTIMSNQLYKSGNIRSNVAWVKEGLCLGINEDVEIRIDERKDLNYLKQVWGCITFGCTRMQEELVFEIQAYEAP